MTSPAVARRRRRKIFRVAGRAILAWCLISLLLVIPWRWLAPPTSSFIIQADSHLVDHDWVPMEKISPWLQLSVLAAEDQRFPEHNGIDTREIRQALLDYQRGKALRGASTISQQVAKNLYLWPGRSLLRKGLEVWMTMLIELSWPKHRILEIYLNFAQFGPTVFGVEAASRAFFGVGANQVTDKQAALIAGVLPAPSLYDARRPSTALRDRQKRIMEQMSNLGGLSFLERL